MVHRENSSTTLGAIGRRVCASIDDAASPRHRESTRLQYGLVRWAIAWGWPEARVLVIDDDLGRSGTSAEGRHGFQRLVAEVGLDHVGLILGVEMLRLARSWKDWHHLAGDLRLCLGR